MNNENIDLIARLLHEEFRGVIQRTKSKIATYTLSSYNLVNKYNLIETEDSIEFRKVDPSVDLDYLLEDVWTDYIKLTDYLFELDPYDKPYDKLNDKYKKKFTELAEKIIGEI